MSGLSPKFAIGDVIFTPITDRSHEMLPCPDCKGSGKWDVTAPSGEKFTASCPRCQSTYSFSDNLPSLRIERTVGGARRHVIVGYEVTSKPLHGECPIRYRTDSSYIIDEDKAFTVEEDAKAAGEALAAKANTDREEKPEVLKSRHFSTLPMDQARTSQMKNGVWESHYHAANLLDRVKSALDGENGDEERSPPEIIEDLREAVRWDFGWHVDHLPLRNLIAAAAASEDESVREALASMPQAMVDLFAPIAAAKGEA